MSRMKMIIRWLDEHFEEMVLIILLLMIAGLSGMQVVMRKIFHNPLTWSEELCRFCFVWSGFLGIGYSIRNGSIIRINTVVGMVPAMVQKIMNLAANIISLIFFLFFFLTSIETIKKVAASGQISPALEIPISILYMGAMIGFLLAIIRVLQSIYKEIRRKAGAEEDIKKTSDLLGGGN